MLANTTFYAAMLSGQPQSLKARLGMVGRATRTCRRPPRTCLDAMTAWDTIRDTVVAEFSDLGDLGQVTQLVVRLVLASLLEGMLGLQRERQGKDRHTTHMLVAARSA